jgi:hypothetical protein
MMKSRERRFITWQEFALGIGKVSTSAHLQGGDMSFRFK